MPTAVARCRSTRTPLPPLPFSLGRALDVALAARDAADLDAPLPSAAAVPLWATDCAAQLGPHGFETDVAAGGRRVVFLHTDGWALKVPRDPLWRRVAAHEFRKRAAVLETSSAGHLPEMYDIGHGAVLQRRYQVDEERMLANLPAIFAARDAAGLTDSLDGNIGWDADRFVFLDLESMDDWPADVQRRAVARAMRQTTPAAVRAPSASRRSRQIGGR